MSSVGLGGLSASNMGFVGGVPVVLIDNATKRSIVLSPLDEFLSTTFTVAADPGDTPVQHPSIPQPEPVC